MWNLIGAVARRFQGWNDGCSLNQTAAYEANMVNLIKDVRKAWKKPALPVTIAASGFDGFCKPYNLASASSS